MTSTRSFSTASKGSRHDVADYVDIRGRFIMAYLPAAERDIVWQQWMTQNDEPITLAKGDMRAVVDSADTWVDDNAAAFDAAFPPSARGVLTNRQKQKMVIDILTLRMDRGI